MHHDDQKNKNDVADRKDHEHGYGDGCGHDNKISILMDKFLLK